MTNETRRSCKAGGYSVVPDGCGNQAKRGFPATSQRGGRSEGTGNFRQSFCGATARGARPCCDDDCFSAGPVCMESLLGSCPEQDKTTCAAGQHQRSIGKVPGYYEVFTAISRAKMQLLQAKWREAGGHGQLHAAWQVRNRCVDRQFRATAHNLAGDLGCTSDMIDGWHGTSEENVYSIAQYGFDTSRRSGQVFGSGEYFAKDPNVSTSYCRGGGFMFLCKLLLGTEDIHHTWVNDMKYYVVKQQKGYVQALPVYLVQFSESYSEVAGWLKSQVHQAQSAEEESTLQYRQRGGQGACEARRDAGMLAGSTSQLWVGWLAPELARTSDDAISDDVCDFLQGIHVAEVIAERNGARVGAHVRLAQPITRATYNQIAARRYRGKFRISVDDGQTQCNPRCNGKTCPRLTGPSGYCRGWNISGHKAWQWGCPFDHPLELRPTHGAVFSLQELQPRTAKYDEIETALMQSAPFHNGNPRLVGVQRVVNQTLERMYEQRRNFLTQKHGFTVEKELWHGTTSAAIPELLTHGLQPPSDSRPSDKCPKSGGKGLCTTLCGTDCEFCQGSHEWDKCHMYGLGVYMADLAQKSHRYVRKPELRNLPIMSSPVKGVGGIIQGSRGDVWGRVIADENTCWRLDSGRIAKKQTCGSAWNWETGAALKPAAREVEVYSMFFCRVCLGNPYLVEGNLLAPSAMHDVCWCQDPRKQLETQAEEWSVARGHDIFYVRGLSGMQRSGLGVYNSEYIVFQPFQVLPLYRVDYTLE